MSYHIRLYADTSVFGGIFDEEFSNASLDFFRNVRAGRFRLVLSRLVEEELSFAPENVREFFYSNHEFIEMCPVLEEAIQLQQTYLFHRIVGRGSEADALHVASATVLNCQMIVSWNFKHIVHFQKIPLYNAVNRLMGYNEIGIYTPLEVIANENEDI